MRGLGMLNIRTIFGETAVRPRKNLKLIVHLEKPGGPDAIRLERLPLDASSREHHGQSGPQGGRMPVAAGRNLAVLVGGGGAQLRAAAARHRQHQEFIQRQDQHLRASSRSRE